MFNFLEVTQVDLTDTVLDTSNQQRIFFDLEGSLTTRGDILQIAAITTDWEFNITDVFNMYFKNRKPILAEEFKVHGISEDFLHVNARGHFTDMISQLPFYPDKPTMFISYTTFDITRIQDELLHYNLPLAPFGTEKTDLASVPEPKTNCYYNAFKLGKKKGDLISKELGEDVFKQIYKELSRFGSYPMKGNHDALYDTVMILALCRGLANVQQST